MPTLEEAKANTRATIEVNKHRIQELEAEIRKLDAIGVNTSRVKIELQKAKERTQQLEKIV